MAVISPYISCLNPVEIYLRKSQKMFVPCRKCPACLNTKRSTLAIRLQLEENAAKYCYFLTLTYNDDNLPLYVLNDDDLLSDYVLPCPVSDRIVSDFNPAHFLSVHDDGILVKKSDDIYSSIHSYNKQVALYEASSHRVLPYGHGKFALLYYRDIQLFLKRLRKFVNKNYNEKIRYYVIGEYGTRSLRPHWHILLFFDSVSLSRQFEDVENVGTSSRRCECPRFLRSLWRYGIVDSKRTNGKAFNYVSSYCAKSSNFPTVLDVLSPQKSYHSRYFGEVLSEEKLLSSLFKHDYSSFANFVVPSYDGSSRPLTLWRSYYSRFLPLYSGISYSSVEETFRILTVWKRVKALYGPSVSIGLAAYRLWLVYNEPELQSASECSIIQTLHVQLLLCTHSDTSVLSALQSALRASRKFLYYADLLSLSPIAYFDIWLGFYKFLGLSQLRALYMSLEFDPTLAHDYYSTMSFRADGSSYPVSYTASDSFKQFKFNQLLKYNNAIKHRATVELINNQLNLI